MAPDTLDSTAEINFLDSFKADTYVVRTVIDTLIRDIEHMGFPKDERDEIVLAMDEAITNAVQETLFIKHSVNHCQTESHEITIRYHLTDHSFDATIIDHGQGLDIDKMMKFIPDKHSKNYKEEIFNYVKKAEERKLEVRVNGREISLNGIGAGLKIILSFMDKLNIDLIDKKKVLSNSVGDTTEGSILNMSRKRRYYA